uniref:Uncharacterized protein n=1 Tax=Romanomermis culicivorax TaxID=13658 RepID=A0A915J2H4_ROMCU
MDSQTLPRTGVDQGMVEAKSEEVFESALSDPRGRGNWQCQGQAPDAQFYNPNFELFGRCDRSQGGQNQGQDGGQTRGQGQRGYY